MGDLYTLLDVLCPLLFAGGLAMTALSAKEMNAAKVMLYAASTLLLVRWGLWAMMSEQHWAMRAMVGAIIGAFLFAIIPMAIGWLNAKAGEASAQTAVRPNGTVINNGNGGTGADIAVDGTAGSTTPPVGLDTNGLVVNQNGPGTGLRVTVGGGGPAVDRDPLRPWLPLDPRGERRLARLTRCPGTFSGSGRTLAV